MNSYDYTPNERRRASSARSRARVARRDDVSTQRRATSSRRPHTPPESRERTKRAAARSPRKERRSVGADVISFPLSIGSLDGSLSGKSRGRGTTARRVQSQREQQGVPVRPAVYTQEKVGVRERMRIARRWGTGTQVAMWQIVLAAVLIGVLVVLAVSGPLHDCYTAWRDSGRLEVEYGVVSSINEELDQDIQELHTEGGVQDEARRLGYVMPDEEALIVKNLEEATPAEAEQVQTALDKYEQGLPWYVHVLDDVMGYKVK